MVGIPQLKVDEKQAGLHLIAVLLLLKNSNYSLLITYVHSYLFYFNIGEAVMLKL